MGFQRAVMDILKVSIGLYVSLVILWVLFRVLNRAPGGVGAFFQRAQKLATPSS